MQGERGISADTALRLARYLRMSIEFWTGIQTHYEVEKAKMRLGDRLDNEVKVLGLSVAPAGRGVGGEGARAK